MKAQNDGRALWNTEKTETGGYPLMEESVSYGGMLLGYGLYLRTGKPVGEYAIRVTLKDQSDEITAGGDLAFAMDCYRSIVRGSVTPCTLADVMEDLTRQAGIFPKNTLQFQ